MKSASEWADEIEADDNEEKFPDYTAFILAIQKDALLAAAETLKKCDCTQSEAKVCQFGPLGICNEPAYWRILELLPEPV